MIQKFYKILSPFFRLSKKRTYNLLFKELEEKIKYSFKNISYLTEALSHRSYINSEGIENIKSNERLEFLGDAVLEIIVSKYLFLENPKKNEGLLTKIRSHWVSKTVIFELAKQMELGKYIYLSPAEIKMGGRERKTIISDAYESLLGAIFLDGGMGKAEDFVHLTMLDFIDVLPIFDKIGNFKSELLEFVQANKLGRLEYKLVETTGPEHKKVFKIAVFINDIEYGIGSGMSKKVAEQEAAKVSLEKLEKSI